MKVHVTTVGNCKRKTMHQLRDHDKQLPYHYYAVKGILSHSAIERCMKDEGEVKTEYPTLIEKRDGRNDQDRMTEELYNASLPEVSRCMRNFGQWLDETDIDLEHMTGEEVQELEYKGHIISGTPDAYGYDVEAKTWRIIDFKTGKPVIREGYKWQVGAYEWLLKQKGKIPQGEKVEATMIFLGDEKPVERTIRPVDVQKGQKEWLEELDRHIEMVDRITSEPTYRPPCEPTFLCTMCEFRSLCSGI